MAIVGGGLSGSLAAWLLRRQGVDDVVLFEAREALGGRILSVDARGTVVDSALPALDRFDLGPTWFWPGMQPQFERLVEELGLPCFEQHDEGDMMVERSVREAPRRTKGLASAPASMRLSGGTGALVAALQRQLDPGRVLEGHAVRALRCVDAQVELDLGSSFWRAEHVLLALPPRLAERGIAFGPPLPTALADSWRSTPTWMAPHAKYVAVYDTPFWREQGLSGAARSAAGPLAEIHDVSMPGGHAALFGFVGVPARMRRSVTDEVMRTHCRAQLGRLFGAQAANPVADALKDWATDPWTATDDDQDDSGQHVQPPPSEAASGPWAGRLTGIGSEWSPEFPGYLAGALDAATRGVQRWRLAG